MVPDRILAVSQEVVVCVHRSYGKDLMIISGKKIAYRATSGFHLESHQKEVSIETDFTQQTIKPLQDGRYCSTSMVASSNLAVPMTWTCAPSSATHRHAAL